MDCHFDGSGIITIAQVHSRSHHHVRGKNPFYMRVQASRLNSLHLHEVRILYLYDKNEENRCNKLTITGFTNEKADTFITNQTKLNKVEVRLGGTNPFLLTVTHNCATLQEYKSRVKDHIQFFLMHNLWIFQDDDLVTTKCDWEMGREYLFLVVLDMEFTLDQLEDFEESWLHRSQLTIDVDEKRFNFQLWKIGYYPY